MNSTIHKKVLTPIDFIFKITFLFIFLLAIISTLYQIYSINKRTQTLLTTFIQKATQAADFGQNFLEIQKDLDLLTVSLKKSDLESGHILLFINGQMIAESGDPSKSFLNYQIENSSVLPSNTKIDITVKKDFFNLVKNPFFYSMIVFLIIGLFLTFVRSSINESISLITLPIEKIVMVLSNSNERIQEKEFESIREFKIDELTMLSNAIEKYSLDLKNNEEQIAKLKQSEFLGSLSKQVAHDIRSPLTALNMAILNIEKHPEDCKKIITSAIHRINEISNELLNRSRTSNISISDQKNKLVQPSHSADLTPLFHLTSTLDSILLEKKMEYINLKNLKIEPDYKKHFSTFIKGNKIEFTRMISNLINNSLDSCKNKEGHITIGARSYKDYVLLNITDNGIGIPQHILAQVGQKNFSYGKNYKDNETGNGLGIYHAKKIISSMGGSFQISSIENLGTTINIRIPTAQAPIYLPKSIDWGSFSKLFILSNDVKFFKVIKDKFTHPNKEIIEVPDLSFPFEKNALNNLKDKFLFIVDLKYSKEKKDLLDFFGVHDLYHSTIFIHGQEDEHLFNEEIFKTDIKLLPMNLLEEIPFIN